MTVYAAFLRSVNVGGHNKVKMTDLKARLQGLGLKGVQTYIQSGNVIFQSDDEESHLRKTLEGVLAESFGIETTAVLRTADDLVSLRRNRPYAEEEVARADAAAMGESFYVALLHHPPTEEAISQFARIQAGLDQHRIVGRDVYLLFQQGVRNAKMVNHLGKLGISTVRNWTTLTKVSELALSVERGAGANGLRE